MFYHIIGIKYWIFSPNLRASHCIRFSRLCVLFFPSLFTRHIGVSSCVRTLPLSSRRIYRSSFSVHHSPFCRCLLHSPFFHHLRSLLHWSCSLLFTFVFCSSKISPKFWPQQFVTTHFFVFCSSIIIVDLVEEGVEVVNEGFRRGRFDVDLIYNIGFM